MIVNLDVKCKVQLNELGKQIWMSQIEELPPELLEANPQIAETIKNEIDEDGCVEMELWGIMNLFGKYISPVALPFTTQTIELNKNPNFREWRVNEDE